VTRWLQLRVRADRLVAAALLVVVAPIVVAAAAVVRLGGAPVLVAVPRVGSSGATFAMWKLRTMRADGPDGLAGGPTLSIGETDVRVTAVGRRLRRWRLDELPNLVNVVRGEMALIGPRPETPDMVDIGDERWATVLTAPPGLVGPSQLLVEAWEMAVLAASGTGAYEDQILPVKLAIDSWYVRNATAATDLLILRALVGWVTGRGRATARLRSAITRDLGNAIAIP
jgi:lipopolysaccharide/colanic/teichoic acid biosynthesis glycosyltransferase